MKILFLCHKTPYPPNDGGAIATLNMIKGFAAAKDDITVLTMQTYKHFYSVDDLPLDLKKNINWNQVKVNTKLNVLKAFLNLLFSKLPYNAQRFQSKLFQIELVQILNSQKFDLVQLEGLYVTTYIPTVRKYSKALISFRAHNVEHEIWDRLVMKESDFLKREYFKLLSRRIKRMEQEVIEKIDLLVPITGRDAVFFSDVTQTNCMVSPTGMLAEKFNLSPSKNSKTVFYIGSLDWLPNQEGLLWFIEKVWNSLHKKFPDWNFVIAGRQAPTEFVKILSRFPVVFAGEVPDSTEFIDAYPLMVVPLLSGSGMRIKIVEAMARGKCVVTTSIGAEGIDATNNRDIIIEDDPLEMGKILDNLLQNPSSIEKYSLNAYKFASENYNNDSIISDLREFYQQKLRALNGIS